MKAIITNTTHTASHGTVEWYRTANGTVMVVTADGRKRRACNAVARAVTATEATEAVTNNTEASETTATPEATEATPEAVTVSPVYRMRRTLALKAARRAFPYASDEKLQRVALIMGDDEIAAEAFYCAASDCGLEDLTDDSNAVEAGRQYQEAGVALIKGKGRKAEELAYARIPATRGRINVAAWLSSLAGRLVTPEDCPIAYIPCAPTQGGAIVVRDGKGDASYFKGDRQGRPVPLRLGWQAFVERVLGPVIGAYVHTATEADFRQVRYMPNHVTAW